MISFNIHEIAINSTDTNFFASQGFENLISVFALLITIGAVIVAIKTYKSDVEQKRKTNTLEYLNNFEYENWISETDKFNWNSMYERLERYSEAEFDFKDTFMGKRDDYDGTEYIDKTINIFSEGEYSHFGKSVIAVMKILEFMAKETNENKLDFGLISLKLLRFYQLANYYLEILDIDNPNKTYQGEFYPETTKLYQRLKVLFSKNSPYLNYCTFQLEQRFQPPKKAIYPFR